MNAVPSFNQGYRLRPDAVRGVTVVLAPERLITLNDPSVAVLQLVDGRRSILEIAAALAARFEAPIETVEADVWALLRDLQREGAIHLSDLPQHSR